MNRNLKKILSGIIVLAMTFPLAACGQGQEGSSEPDTELQGTPAAGADLSTPSAAPSKPAAPVADGTEGNIFAGSQSGAPRVTVLLPCSNEDFYRNPNQWHDRLIIDIDDYTGIDLRCKWYLSKTYYEQLGQEMASGKLTAGADAVYVRPSDTFWEAAEKGMFWDLSPYIDDESYDNLTTMPEAVRMTACRNGKMYGLPYGSDRAASYGLSYRADWLERLGLDVPADWESFCKMLYAFTYNDPDGNGRDDTVGLFLDGEDVLLDVMECWFGVPNVWGIDENGELIHKTRTQEYREAYAAFRSLYAQGVINNGANGIPDFKDIAGKTTPLTIKEAVRTSRAGAVVSHMTSVTYSYFDRRLRGLPVKDELTYGILPCVDTGRGTLCYPSLPWGMFAISKETVTNEEQLKTVLQFFNDINDAPCCELILYGWEGLSYTLDENGDIMAISEISDTLQELLDSGIQDHNSGTSYLLLRCTAAENASTLHYDVDQPYDLLADQVQAENKNNCVVNYGAQFVSETYEEKGAELDAALFEAEIQYMTGGIDEAGFEAALEAWWTGGGESITRELNEKYHAAGY